MEGESVLSSANPSPVAESDGPPKVSMRPNRPSDRGKSRTASSEDCSNTGIPLISSRRSDSCVGSIQAASASDSADHRAQKSYGSGLTSP